jgi:hypothetical protein
MTKKPRMKRIVGQSTFRSVSSILSCPAMMRIIAPVRAMVAVSR